MLEVVRSRSGCAGWFAGDLDPETQDWLLPLDRLRGDIQDLIDKGQPLALLGTAFHFVHLTDHLASAPIRLPPGSWIMETGGYKGRSRSLPRAALLQRIERVLDVPPDRVLGEYGMCELGSQAYDLPLGADPTLPNERVYRFPPWAQTLILSPEDDQPVEEDGAGLLHVVDLANAWSAVSIRTGDLVRRRGEGFELLGRASPADPRGCSLNLAPPSLLS